MSSMHSRSHVLAGWCVLLVITTPSSAQTNPSPLTLPVVQNWGTAGFGAMPPGFAAWNGLSGGSINSLSAAQSSVPNGDATLITSPPSGTPTGGTYGYVHSPGNAILGIVTSGNAVNGVNQLAMAINTVGVSGVSLQFDCIEIVNNIKTVGCVVQYRMGAAGAWATIPGAGNPYVQSAQLPGFEPGPPVAITHVSLALPAAAENQPLVQIRWAVWRGVESGNSSAFGIDNIVVQGSGGSGGPPSAFAGADRTLPMTGTALPVVMVDAIADDPDGLAGLTYEWSPASGTNIAGWTARTGGVVQVVSPGQAQVTLTAPGEYAFTLTVIDPEQHAVIDQVVITVVPVAPTGGYDPPAGYYNPARPGGQWLNGAALKTALSGIIDNHHVRSYDDARNALQILDQDPDNPGNLLLIYTGASVPKIWDGGNTWNREHQWPDSLLLGSPQNSDLFELRPSDPGLNSARGNDPYGIGAGFWDPAKGNAADRGACARACFYMATRYASLSLVNGPNPASGQMADLARMLVWHYEQAVTPFERRRNHLIWSQADNPTYYQENRNPYVDHPELVWSAFGPGANNATLHVAALPDPDGASAIEIDLRLIVNAPTAGQTFTLNKLGAHPTTFDITVTGNALCMPAGPRRTFTANAQTIPLLVGPGSTAVPGHHVGAVVIDNTDITSAGPGQGAADANDVIHLMTTVLDHANASFSGATDLNAITIDFGTYVANNGVQTRSSAIHNLQNTPGLTAALAISPPLASGDTAMLSAALTGGGTLPAGASRLLTASLDTAAPGSFSATCIFPVADELLPGAISNTPLVLTLVAEVIEPAPPFAPADFDHDGDVDADDFERFMLCGTRSGLALGPGCAEIDTDQDNDGDLDDFARLQRCYSGPARPATPTCAD